MQMKVLLPRQVFTDQGQVSRIVAPGIGGSFGLLPHRLDCVSALKPGILTYQVETQDETYLAIDDGVLVKTGFSVVIAVRRAIPGSNLENLAHAVTSQFLSLDANQKQAKAGSLRLEAELTKGMERLVAK
jgi:F-type H+-transporting ATPase subunit epsilon